jgi:hypothetical protein
MHALLRAVGAEFLQSKLNPHLNSLQKIILRDVRVEVAAQ